MYRYHEEGAGLAWIKTLGVGVKFLKRPPKVTEVSHGNLGYLLESQLMLIWRHLLATPLRTTVRHWELSQVDTSMVTGKLSDVALP